MSFCSQALLRRAVPLAAVLVLSACAGDDRPVPLSGVEITDVPVVVDPIPGQPPGASTNENITNPTLTVPETFSVSDGDQLTLVWNDEFDSVNLDPEVWFFATGDGTEKGIPGWGNNELQYYLPDNAMLVNGVLEITARRETVENFNYTSARINTEHRFAFKYGRIEASIKLPAGQGIWPAFWMLPQDTPYGAWAASGEIDIMEAVNLDGTGGNEIYATLHYGGEAPANTSTGDTYTPSEDVTEGFHTYAVEWSEFEIRWYFDGQLYAVQNSWNSTAAPYPAPFNQPFHILLNVAVGGNFPGAPNGATVFPVTMEVDWVRVYSGEEGEELPPEPADPGIIPEAVVYASDQSVTVDLPPGFFSDFGSGSAFDGMYASDADFNPAFQVTSGEGYGAGVHVGFVALGGYAGGFAAGYETVSFKVKGLPSNVIEVKFFDPFAGDGNPPNEVGVNYDVTTYAGSTALGNGWYQLVIPLSDFSTFIDINEGFLLGPPGDQGAPFTFLLTDIGFNGTAGGGGGGTDGTVFVTFDEVPPPVVTEFGGAVPVIETGPAGGDGSNALNIVRNGGEVFAGAWIAIPTIPSDAGTQTVSALVYSPTAGIPMVAKAEYGDNTGTGDVQANESVVVGWQTLSWTFTNLDSAQVYNRFTLLPNLGTVDAAATSYFFDNLTLLATDGGSGGGTGGGGTGGGTAGDIAINGGFETGSFNDGSTNASWQQFLGGGIQTIVTSNPSSGTFAANLVVPVRGGADPAVDNLIKNANLQAGNLTPGASITVSFDMRGSLSGAGGVVFAEFFSELSGGGTSKAEIFTDGPLTPNPDWTTYSFTTTLGPDVSGGVTLQLKASCGPVPGCGVDVFFDNVSITTQ